MSRGVPWGRTGIKKLIVAFHNFTNAPKYWVAPVHFITDIILHNHRDLGQVVYIQGCTYFPPKILKLPQIFQAPGGWHNAIPYRGPTKIRRHRTKLLALATWRPGFVQPVYGWNSTQNYNTTGSYQLVTDSKQMWINPINSPLMTLLTSADEIASVNYLRNYTASTSSKCKHNAHFPRNVSIQHVVTLR